MLFTSSEYQSRNTNQAKKYNIEIGVFQISFAS